MSRIEQSIEVEAPLTTVYNQWTQFEESPVFMEGVEEVRQLDDSHLHWVAELDGPRGGESGGWRGEVKRPDGA